VNQDKFDKVLRKYLKIAGESSQREIESALRVALECGEIEENERLRISMTIAIDKLGLTHIVEDEISLE